MRETRDHPAEAGVPLQALDLGVAEQLWDVSEKLADVRFDAYGIEGRSPAPNSAHKHAA